MTKVPVSSIQAGDVIMPPERELRLWMRRTLAERGLPEEALHITVTEVRAAREGWAWIKGNGQFVGRWSILAKLTTKWPVISHLEA